MNEWRAIDLVRRYSYHTRRIKELGKQIGESLELCPGLDGKRLEMGEYGYPVHPRDTDGKNRDTSTHLWHWYQPDIVDDGYMNPGQVWTHVGDLEAEECPHCYAAHLAIQERKEHRKKLGAVKSAMTRGGAA